METTNGKIHDNRTIDGVTYDTIATERMLGISASQLNTLVKASVLLPCNERTAGHTKFYRRFTASAIESARPQMAAVLKPQRPAPVETQSLASLHDKVDRIEAMVSSLHSALNGRRP